MIEIRSAVELPAERQPVSFLTSDGIELVGELALPLGGAPEATIVTLHPNPTQGGNMDSHIFRKLANRLPALSQVAVLRFNTRGTSSPRGTSSGSFGDTFTEGPDVRAAVEFAIANGLDNIWLVGWSFGTELILKYGLEIPEVHGFVLLSPPLYRVTPAELARWAGDPRPIIALVPEHDSFLTPEQAVGGFAPIPQIDIRAFADCKHLWVGETQARQVINEVAAIVAPHSTPLPTHYAGAEALGS